MVATEKTESRIIQLTHATVQYTNDCSLITHEKMPMLKVQAIDQYGFQREWSLGLKREYNPNTRMTSIFWESHIYQHPGRREICIVGAAQAKSCIKRFLYVCDNYPSLLFNEEGFTEGTHKYMRPRHEGFVRFAECLHRGMVPSMKML